MIRQAAQSIDSSDADVASFCAMAKLFACDECFDVVDACLQAHGGYGYLRDYPLERHLRDIRVHRILEGTDSAMRMTIAKALLKDQDLR